MVLPEPNIVPKNEYKPIYKPKRNEEFRIVLYRCPQDYDDDYEKDYDSFRPK